jgi:molybdopterin converting factor small subunit
LPVGVRVTIRLFGAFREAVGQARLLRDLPPGVDLDGLWRALAAEYPALAALDPVRLSAVNLDYASGDRRLVAGDEVAFFPPVSGG